MPGIKALFDALNIVYGEREKRSFIHYLGLSDATQWLVTLGKWPVMLIAVGIAVALIYRYGPSRNQAQWRWITWGSAFAAVGWLAVSILFAWYAANFGNFNKTYG